MKLLAQVWALALAGLLGAGQAWAAAPFVDNGDGTVTDTSTGLMWDQCVLGQTQGSHNCTNAPMPFTWIDAVEQAALIYQHRGYSDWRLPNVYELRTLLKPGTNNPSIDSGVFPNTPASTYWTSTSGAPDPSLAWFVHFYSGGTYADGKTYSYYVRLVRSGQSFGAFGFTRIDVSGITQNTATLTATSPVVATGYWMVVPRAASAPLASEIIGGVASYRGVTVAARGNAPMSAASAKTFAISGLQPGTNYDLYLVAQEAIYASRSAVMGPLAFATAPSEVYPLWSQLTVSPAGTGAGIVSASGGVSCVRAGGGSLGVCSATYDYFSTPNVTLTATAAAGSRFTGWGGACSASGTAATCTVSMGSDRSVTASFANPVAVTQIVLDPITPSTLYSSLDGGGVYKKTASADWAAINTGLSNLSVKALAIKPDASRLFAGTDGGGVFYGDGSSWAACANTGNGMSNLFVRSLTVSGSTLYAGTASGVFVSTDGCATWAAMSTGLPN